jgi:hypothetical protein
MNLRKIGLLLVAFAFIFTSCSSDDDATISVPLGDYENGILVSHEGNFGQGNASVSFISYDFETVDHSIFSDVNNGPLGDTAQSIAFNGSLAYIVLNNSNAVKVVNRYTFELVASIESGLSNPRHIAFANGKGFVTNWGDGGNPSDDYLAIIDLASNTISSNTIPVVEGPEEIVANGSTVFVAHQGGFGQNDKISIVDASANTVSQTITVGDVPNSLHINGGYLWVLAGGKPSWTGSETGGKLSRVNLLDYSVTSMDFATTEHPNFLNIENGNLYYYMAGSIYKMQDSDTSLPTESEVDGLNFYGMSVNNGLLYGVDAGDFTSPGLCLVYDLDSNTQTQSFTVGIIPGGVYFN